ncbi:hypothetical protein BH23CHL5_BH23CHL5_02130 [soil metagenome]
MIRLGIIGCEDVAFRTYIPGILPHDTRATVIATFDPIQERAERAAAAFPGARVFKSLEAFLSQSDLDEVFNLTPATLHSAINTAVIQAKLHLYTEKPITATVQEGIAPATMATDRFQWIKALVDAGRLGSLTVGTGQMVSMGPANWRAYAGDPAVFYSRDVGPVVDTAVYVLHGLTGIFGPALRVQAMAGIGIPERTVHIPRL